MSKANIERSEKYFRGILTRDYICRKDRSWKLLDEDAMVDMLDLVEEQMDFDDKSLGEVLNCFVTQPYWNHPADSVDWPTIQKGAIETLDLNFPLITQLLQFLHGRIVAAGGAIFKAVERAHTNKYVTHTDIDLFFIDADIESDLFSDEEKISKANAVLVSAITYLTDSWTRGVYCGDEFVDRHVIICRNEFVTTVYLCADSHESKIQFIHRVYPTIGSVLGGFDLGPCMVAYDGQRITGTEFGVWSALSRIAVVDTSRRSTSFEHRIIKYNQYCSVVFLGLPCSPVADIPMEWLPNREKAFEVLQHKAQSMNWCLEIYGSNLCLKEFKSVGIEDLLWRLRNLATQSGYHLEIDVENLHTLDLVQTESGTIRKPGSKDEAWERLDLEARKLGYDITRYHTSTNKFNEESNHLRPLDLVLKLPYLNFAIGDWLGETSSKKNRISGLPRNLDGHWPLPDNDYDTTDQLLDGSFIQNDYADTTVWPLLTPMTNLSSLLHGNIAGVVSVTVIKNSGVKIPLPDNRHADRNIYDTCLDALASSTVDLPLTKDSKAHCANVERSVREALGTVSIGNVGSIFEYMVGSLIHGLSIRGLDAHQLEENQKRSRAFLYPNLCRLEEGFDPTATENLENLLETVKNRVAEAQAKLQTVQWIIRNPGRQWTSSINPIVADPRDWYGKHYRSFRIGNPEIIYTLRLFRLRRDNYFACMDRGLFNYLLRLVLLADSYCY
jgi:hypothetical protein